MRRGLRETPTLAIAIATKLQNRHEVGPLTRVIFAICPLQSRLVRHRLREHRSLAVEGERDIAARALEAQMRHRPILAANERRKFGISETQKPVRPVSRLPQLLARIAPHRS